MKRKTAKYKKENPEIFKFFSRSRKLPFLRMKNARLWILSIGICHVLLPPLQSTELPAYLPSRPLQAIVSEYDVYQHLKRIAKSKSGPDDIPPRLLREFAPEPATFLCDIFNCSSTEGVVPDLWKRAITIIANLETSSSTVYYLVDLINYITSNVDKQLEVTTATIDLRKAFDLIEHTTLNKKIISLGFHEGWVK
ncbi:uncharacterized protein [Penaeus vannamei]|uniref:uncharacterized protein n=1 Tax=Penaeus vannamei TaxID=6689 RepID=UPI00387F7B79